MTRFMSFQFRGAKWCALCAVLSVLAVVGTAQARTAAYNCAWSQHFDLTYGTAPHSGTYTGYGNGTCYLPSGALSGYLDDVSDSGTWTSVGIPYQFSYACDNVYPVNHSLTGQATLFIASDDDIVVPYQLTEAGGVIFKGSGAYSTVDPAEQVSVDGTGYLSGFSSCPNDWFDYTGTLHITTTG